MSMEPYNFLGCLLIFFYHVYIIGIQDLSTNVMNIPLSYILQFRPQLLG